MKIRIIDVDSIMVNHAILKIAGYHKSVGDDVAFYNPLTDYSDTEKAYASKIFQFSDDYNYFPECGVIKGGSGYDLKSMLPNEIENADPDYSIYPNCDYSIVFFSRGCNNNCPFCIVRQKEGYIHSATPMKLNPNGKHIEVLDNSFFANPEWENASKQLIEWNQPVNFHGIDIRTLTEANAEYLNKIKRYKQIHIAWDNPKVNLIPKLQEAVKWIKPYKLMCYVLIGYWSTPEEDLYRVQELRNLNIDPFVMPFNKADPYQRNFARWVNHKAVFKTVTWEDYRKVAI